MSRPVRIEYENALNHAVSGGDNRRWLVRDDAGRKKRMMWLQGVVGPLGWKLYGLMGWQAWPRGNAVVSLCVGR